MLAGLCGDFAYQMEALLLSRRGASGSRAGVRFVNNHEFRALLDKDISAIVGFDEVDADDLIGVVVINTGIALNLTIQPSLSIRTNDHRFNVEFRPDFLLPLLAEMRQTNDRKALDLPSLKKLPHDEQRFNRLTDTDVISDK